jgi:hypothetical protein
MGDNIKMSVLVLVVAFIASIIKIKFTDFAYTNVMVQSLISFSYFFIFCIIYYVAISIFSGNSQDYMFIFFEILITSTIFGVWIFSTTYLSDFFSNAD